MLNPERYIYCVEESDRDNLDLKEYIPGWYFVDEAEQFEGPFGTIEECREMLKKYGEWLNQP